MQMFLVMAIFFYMLSAGAYFAYLFLQREFLHHIGCSLLTAGFLCQTIIIAWDLVTTGHMPVNNLHQTLTITAWTLAGLFLILYFKFKLKILGIYAAPLVTFILLLSSRFPSTPVQPQNLLKGFWLFIHIITVFAGHAAFALACGVGILYLIQENNIKNKTRDFFFKRLPSLDLLDTFGHACIVIGFVMLTIGLISGMVYAKNIWGHFWSWDHKEIWSAIVWIFYAVLLHERLTIGWRGRRAAIMAIVGFGVLSFSFLGVNLLLKGHHGQFTRW